MDTNTIVVLLQSTIRVSVPLILTALAGLYAERSGVVDIGLEGKMLAAAFAGAATAAVTGSALTGIGAAMLVSVALSLVHGYASISQRGDQVVSARPSTSSRQAPPSFSVRPGSLRAAAHRHFPPMLAFRPTSSPVRMRCAMCRSSGRSIRICSPGIIF